MLAVSVYKVLHPRSYHVLAEGLLLWTLKLGFSFLREPETVERIRILIVGCGKA
jgi:hypothetical protein